MDLSDTTNVPHPLYWYCVSCQSIISPPPNQSSHPHPLWPQLAYDKLESSSAQILQGSALTSSHSSVQYRILGWQQANLFPNKTVQLVKAWSFDRETEQVAYGTQALLVAVRDVSGGPSAFVVVFRGTEVLKSVDWLTGEVDASSPGAVARPLQVQLQLSFPF